MGPGGAVNFDWDGNGKLVIAGVNGVERYLVGRPSKIVYRRFN